MIKLLRRNRSRILYTNCDIPARLFFDELMQGNISVLGKGTPTELHNAYMAIVDEYCELDNNRKMLDWFTKQNRISKIQRGISDVALCLAPIKYICITESQFKRAINNINYIDYPKVKFDIKKPLNDEIKRVEHSVIGMLKNELNMLVDDNTKSKEKIQKDFFKRLVSVQNALGRNLDDNISLRKFIYEEKSAIDKCKPNKK